MGELYDNKQLKYHLAESRKRLPGPPYQKVLKWVHQTLRPATYVEIGVSRGDSIKNTMPTTKLIGIDPSTKWIDEWSSHSRANIFNMTSDEFFERAQTGAIPEIQGFSLAFIDGLHTYDQALRDFINLEKFSSPDSVIMLHDCIPLDEISASNPRASHFYTGDVWKTLLIIARSRPDLRICIVPTWPSGLVLVTNLDSKSDILQEKYSTLVDQYRLVPFKEYFSTVSELPPPVPIKESVVKQFLQD
jgi:Methyltransferase domain